MIIVFGGGQLAEIIYKTSKREKIPVQIYSSKVNKNNSLYSGKNNSLLRNLLINGNNNKCIILWSFTHIKNIHQFQLSIEGMMNILQLIKANPNNEYIYLSSTSADLKYNYLSLYGLSKFLHEQYFLKYISNQENIKFKIVRVGLIYGMQNCPIKKIIRLRDFGIKLILGDEKSNFSVISALDLANNLINENSFLWKNEFQIAYLGEITRMSIKKIHLLYDKIDKKNFFFKIVILKKSFLYKFLHLIGFKLDLSLSEIDRFPSNEKLFKYHQILSIENYINKIKMITSTKKR